MKSILSILSILIVSCMINAEYTKLKWVDNGSPKVNIYDIDITPMPIIQPGNANIVFDGNFKTGINGPLKTTLSIKRTVFGISLPVNWYVLDIGMNDN